MHFFVAWVGATKKRKKKNFYLGENALFFRHTFDPQKKKRFPLGRGKCIGENASSPENKDKNL